jgi:transcriptional regulator with XRE-family HTH domain
MSRKHLLSVDDVAELLGIAPSTLSKWRQTGTPDLPYLRINGRIRYRASDVDEFIDDAEEAALDDEADDDGDDYVADGVEEDTDDTDESDDE